MVTIASRYLKAFIGADEQEWTLSVGTFSSNWDSLDESGLIQVEAELTILPNSTNPESINAYDNPARWRPVTPVRIEVANSSGTFVVHPHGRLFIIEEPDFPEPGQGIVLSLGCRLASHNSFEFDDERMGVTVGSATNSATVASTLLQANEIPSGVISLGTWPYSLSLPEGKGQSRSFIQQAGELAYSNDYRYLYQAVDGTVTAAALDLSISDSPTVTVTLGTNDIRYQAVKSDGTPPELIRAAGTGTNAEGASKPIVEVVEVTGDRTQFEVGGVSCPGTGVIGRTTNLITWDTSGDPITYTSRSTLEAPRSSVASDPASIFDPCDLIHWKTEESVKRFDATTKRLIDTTTTESQRRFTLTGNVVTPILPFQIIRRTTETPTYGEDEVVTKIVVVEEQAEVLLDKNSANPYSLRTVKETETRWRQISDQTWRKTETIKLPKALRNASPEGSPFASVSSSGTSTSTTGQTQPPRAELWDDAVTTKEIEYQGEATYTLPGGGTGRTRKQLYTIPYGFSDQQMEGLALTHEKLIAGRHRGCMVEIPITDALLSAPPLFPFDVVFPSGEVRHYRADGVTFEHIEDQATAVVIGILVGTTAAPTEEVPEPSPVPLTGMAVVDDDTPVVDGGEQVVAVV